MTDILVFGASGHASVVIDAIEEQGMYNIVGLLDPDVPVGEVRMGYPLLGKDEDLSSIMASTGAQAAFVALGDNGLRRKVAAKALSLCPALTFVTAIHPAAVISRHAVIGPGTLVMPGAVVNANVAVGMHAIINTQSVVEHDCRVDDFSHIGPGAVLGGSVRIGQGALIGLGARVLPGKSVGTEAVLGAGATAVYDVPKQGTWVGTPAQSKG